MAAANEYEIRRSAACGASVRYSYTARDMKGRTFRGVAEVSDYESLYAQLRAGGYYLVKASRLEPERRKTLGFRQLAEFCRELAGLLGAGVNLVRALTILSREEDLPAAQAAIYGNLLEEVRKGVSLSRAMERQRVFPDLMLGMVRAGEENGSLDGVMTRLAGHYTHEYKLSQQIRSAMTYPIILAAVTVAAMVIIFTCVLPEFEELFRGMDNLPLLTVFLLRFSDFLATKWYAAIGAAAVLGAAVRALFHLSRARLAIDKWKIKTRLFGLGRLNSIVCTARFARTIASLYSSGVPLAAALQTGRETIGNRYLAGQFDEAVRRVRSGDALSSALSGVDGFQRKLISTIQVGEETGRLDRMLNGIADTMEYDSEQACKRMIAVLEPALIVLMAVIVGVIMFGVMLPIISSYGAIENLFL